MRTCFGAYTIFFHRLFSFSWFLCHEAVDNLVMLSISGFLFFFRDRFMFSVDGMVKIGWHRGRFGDMPKLEFLDK
jgi:hypothetical protein